jgi:hypothetical protein
MQEAIRLGYVPTQEEATKTAAAIDTVGASSETAASKVTELFGISGGPLFDTLEELIGKANAAAAAVDSALTGSGGGGSSGSGGSGSSSGSGGSSSSGGSGGSVLDDIINQPKGSGLTPFDPANDPILGPGQESGSGGGGMGGSGAQTDVSGAGASAKQYTFGTGGNLNQFALGGIVPGGPTTPVPIIAHGGEAVIPSGLVPALERLARGGGGSGPPVVHLTVHQSGTVIQQERDWQTFVTMIQQSLAGRR